MIMNNMSKKIKICKFNYHNQLKLIKNQINNIPNQINKHNKN